MSAYRDNATESIDSLRAKIKALEDEVQQLNEKKERRKAVLGFFKRRWQPMLGVVVVVVAAWLGWTYNADRANTLKEHNAKYEAAFFGAGSAWIKKYNKNRGNILCSIESTKSNNDGRLPAWTMCTVRYQDDPSFIKLECYAPTKHCFLVKKVNK